MAYAGLPEWLLEPNIYSADNNAAFADFGLHSRLLDRLKKSGFAHTLGVQTAIFEKLLGVKGQSDLHDFYVNSPTGSGKTLAYLVPIVEQLRQRGSRALRCLIIVPTKELVNQVKLVLEMISTRTGIVVQTATSSRKFDVEQKIICGQATSDQGMYRPLGGTSLIDILVATPGRLVEHILQTPGFTLQHLEFLVIDEADRLLGQIYQDWLTIVIKEIHQPRLIFNKQNPKLDAQLPDHVANWCLGKVCPIATNFIQQEHACRKMVFSATLSKDPEGIELLRLRNPQALVIGNTPDSNDNTPSTEPSTAIEPNDNAMISLPAELSEYVLPCEASEKPLQLLFLLSTLKSSNILIFTATNEKAERLCTLLKTINPKEHYGLLTSKLSARERKKSLHAISAGDIPVLVCSDLASRGIDIKHLAAVINYDVPRSVRQYVHRVGRTSRAGSSGKGFTLLEDREARWFWRNIGRGLLKRMRPIERLKQFAITNETQTRYAEALASLKNIYR